MPATAKSERPGDAKARPARVEAVCYEGQKNSAGERHGNGTMTWPAEGRKYVGEWKDHTMHGQVPPGPCFAITPHHPNIDGTWGDLHCHSRRAYRFSWC